MAARARTWNDEVQALLAIWADASIQRQLLGEVRNTTVFNKMERAFLNLLECCAAIPAFFIASN